MEPEKKFKNLNSRYTKYLNEVSKILINYDRKKEYTFEEINGIYETISKINVENLIVENDINHLFQNYAKSNETIIKLESIVKKRNTIIIKNLLTSELYKKFINKLSVDHKSSSKKIETIILKLIKKYSMVWKCCWTFIEITNNGVIKNIQLFDINDINFIKENLKQI